MVTEEDVAMVDYFYNERGDVTRWGSWAQRKPDIKKEYPELIEALDAIEKNERQVKRIIKYMEDEIGVLC